MTRSAALAPSPLHAHVERPVAAEGEAALGLVELHRRDADVENDAVDALEAGFRGDRVERAEAAGHENEPALALAAASAAPAAMASGSRSMAITRLAGWASRMAAA